MTIKVRQIDDKLDRQIITNMIVNDRFLKSVSFIYDSELMKSQFAVTIAQWCLDYLKQHDKAPKKHIQDIFYAELRKGLDEDQADGIKKFLISMSEEYEESDQINVDYLLKQTNDLFTSRRLQIVAEDLTACLSNGDSEEALAVLSNFKLPEHTADMGIDPLQDTDAILNANRERQKPLFVLRGALGALLNPHLIRGGFIGFLGRAKIGKTWRLIDFAMQAARQRRTVAIFQMGDLSQDDYINRQSIYVSGVSNDRRYCGDIKMPVLDCHYNQTGACKHGNKSENLYASNPVIKPETQTKYPNHQPCSNCRRKSDFHGAVWWEPRGPVEPLSDHAAARNTIRWRSKNKAKPCRLKVFPNSSANVASIENTLDLWEAQLNFIPDVIIVDYPDIMAPEDSRKERRHQENERWQALRRLSQERNCLVIVVTQADSASYDQESLKLSNFNEDRRKYDHVTAFFALNQTNLEASCNIFRVAALLVREGAKEDRQAVVLQSLETGKPHIASYWWHKNKI